MKYKNTLIKKINANNKFQLQQDELKSKHNITEEKVIVVEKNNIIKFLLNTFGKVIRTSATITILLLACIGALSLIYPTCRTEIFKVCNDTFHLLFKLF